MENIKEAYIDYLVRKVSEGVSNVIDKKIETIKSEILNLDYKHTLEKTELLLTKYKELKKHVEMSEFSREEIQDETYESYNQEIEQMMTEVFSESETYIKGLLRNRYKTKALILFIEKILNDYLEQKTYEPVELRKRKILKELYIEGGKQTEFILNNYDLDRTFYKDKTRLIKDLAPYFFGIKGIEI